MMHRYLRVYGHATTHTEQCFAFESAVRGFQSRIMRICSRLVHTLKNTMVAHAEAKLSRVRARLV